MGSGYKQLSLDERCQIARLQADGLSLGQIAAALDRAPSTISRELKRNCGRQVGYKPTYAQEQAKARRWTGSRLERETGLRRAVCDGLTKGWSPEQVAGRLAREAGRTVISYESIYRFIYAQIARTKDYRWRRLLPRGKSKRGFRGRKGGSAAHFIEGRVSLLERPSEAADRKTAGHWEADLMLFSKYGQAILTVHERHSRLLLAMRPPNKAAEPIARHLASLFTSLPPSLRRTVTFDNGTEFARHRALHRLGMETFFCDPYSPWQKGGVENAIGRMRRFIPRKTDLAILSEQRFRALIATYNNTPRKCLDWRTPAETFSQLLHFECESTSPLSRGRAEGRSRSSHCRRRLIFLTPLSSDSIFKQPAKPTLRRPYSLTARGRRSRYRLLPGLLFSPRPQARGWSAARRHHVVRACEARARLVERRARLAALHLRRFQSPDPRFLGRGNAPVPVQQSSLQSGRSTARSGPGASRVRGCEPRPQAPPLPHSENASRSAPHGQVN